MKVFSLRRLFGSARGTPAADPYGSHDYGPHDPYWSDPDGSGPAGDRRPELPRIEAAYGHGVRDGRRQLDQEAFGSYLDSSVEERAVELELDGLRERERRLIAEQTELAQRRAGLDAAQTRLEDLRESERRASARLEELEHDLEAIEEERSAAAAQGSVLYLVLFLAAAAAFVLADVVITREIVADALGLTGRLFLGVDESWFFAVGLALVPVLLKPAYDRLVEDPWWQGRRAPFTATILTSSALAIGTLAVLGIYRSIAHDVRTRLELVLSDTRLDAAERAIALESLQESLLGTSWGTWAFILSAILFAVAGAICLGIALRHARDFWAIRVPLFTRRITLRRGRGRAEREQRRVGATIVTQRSELAKLDRELASSPAERLAVQIQEVRAQQADLRRRLADARRARVRALYGNGYEMGAELGESARVRRPVRPYVAVRHAIRAAAGETGADAPGVTSP